MNKLFIETYNEKELKKRLEVNPNDLHSMLRLADIYNRKKKMKDAIQLYDKIAKEYLILGKKELAKGIYNVIATLYPQYSTSSDLLKSIPKEKDISGIKDVKEFLKRTELFKNFSEEHLEYLKSNSVIREFKKNDTIITEGEKGDSIFIILEGNVKIYITTELGKIEEVAILTQGNFFGEMGFFGNGIRRASVDALDDVKLLEIPKTTIQRLIEIDPKIQEILFRYYQERILDLILATSPLFSGLDSKIRKELISRFKLVKFKKGDLIIREGEYSDSMYLIKSGEVEVFIEKDGEKRLLATLSEGEFFGEIAVLTGQKRTANVIAKTDVELLELTKRDIDEIIQIHPVVLDVLKSFVQERSSDTFQKLMELKRISAKKGLI